MEDGALPLRSWSAEKLQILGEYLQAYTVIMRKQKETWLRSFSYIDAFAATGTFVDVETKDVETKEYTDGSPFVALRTSPSFDDYCFIELDADRLNQLKTRVSSECPTCSVDYRHGDANDVLVNYVAKRITYSNNRRGFVFLDPYGLEVGIDTVKALGDDGAFDVLINLSTMGITRLLDRNKAPSARSQDILQRVFGDLEWVEEQYVVQQDLFGEERVSRDALAPTQIAEAYIERLRPHFAHFSKPILMRNSRNAPLYVLFMASQKPAATKITNDILAKYERLRQGRG
jgi:three-Cys-motif partner protein